MPDAGWPWLAVGVVIGALFVWGLMPRRDRPADPMRMARLERRVDDIAATVGLPPDALSTAAHPSAQVLALIDGGNKIGAIKQYRTETGSGLREAKEAVEAFERGQR